MNVLDILNEIKCHSCPKKTIILSDDPKNRIIGFRCVSCGVLWKIRIYDVRQQESTMRHILFYNLLTTRGRTWIAEELTKYQNVITVTKEEMICRMPFGWNSLI